MPGKKSQLTPLETRKQMLLVESELNRAQLLNEMRDFKNEIQLLKDKLYVIGSVTSAAAKLAVTLSAVGRAFSLQDGVKSSWVSALVNGAKAGASLWRLMRSDRHKT
jgi:hypothetical protein